jgi:nicotinate phosphoribosyltransferase
MTVSSALLTDFYQLSMAFAYWKAGQGEKESVFHLFFRKPPFQGGFTVASGLEPVIHYLESFRFQESDLDYLASLKAPNGAPYFSSDFFSYLRDLRFTCDIDAAPEGSVVFPQEPLIRVKGPLLQCQLLESPLLNLVNFPTLIATKAARICIAADGDPVFEFGLRRAQGVDGAMTASRSAYIGGCNATSNTLAGKVFGIPVQGTHSHSWVMVFDDELTAFKTYAECLPDNCVFLVDTYNTLKGVENAIEVGKSLRSKGKPFIGIRLDSGDLAYLSIQARKMLDSAGFEATKIFASNELDEVVISELKRQGAEIDVWGVGTHLVTGKGQAALDGVYKISAIRNPNEEWRYTLKLSEQLLKVSNPGILQVRRFKKEGQYLGDAIFDENSPFQGDCHLVDPLDPTREKIFPQHLEHEDLLVPIFRGGKRVYSLPLLSEIRQRTQKELSKFPVGIKRFLNPHQYIVGMEKSIHDQKVRLIKQTRAGRKVEVPE